MRLTTTFALAAALFALCFPLPASVPASAEPAPSASNLTGVWKDSIDYTFRILQVPGASTLTSEVLEDTCTGGPREFVINAQIDGVAINGTMQRCDDADHPLVVGCGLPTLWETPFWANVTDEGRRISGIRQGEYYVWDTDENGSYQNCRIDYYTNVSFEFERVDCGVKTFEELAEHHIPVEADRADAIALAQAFEDGQKLHWTEGQLEPGALKDQIERLKRGLEAFGYTVTINSAYRPIIYQGHFADLRICGLELFDIISGRPYLAEFLRESVDAINAEVAEHAIKAKDYNVSGLTIKVPFVCYREPLTNCPHTDERAADLSVSPNDTRVDWIGSLFSMCRPYLFAKTPDPPHWENRGADVFADPMCAAQARLGMVDLSISGNSPVNILLTDSQGNRVGYDPVAQEAVNDFGSWAYYSGPGTQPQVIEVYAEEVVAGAYTVSGVGTGAGPYSIDFSAVDDGGYVVDEGRVSGVAATDVATTPLSFVVEPDYWPEQLWQKAAVVSVTGAATDYSVPAPGGAQSMRVEGGLGGGVLYDAQDRVIAIQGDGSAGETRVTVPKGLMGGDFTVRVDGVEVAAARAEGASGTTLTFQRPTGHSFITVEATAPGTAGGGPGPSGGGDLMLLAIIGAVAAVAAAVAVVILRRAKKPGGPPQ